MDQKKARLLTGIVSAIGLLAWLLIVVQIAAYIKRGDSRGAVADATGITGGGSPSVSAAAQEPTAEPLPSPTEMVDERDLFYSDEDGWVTVTAEELRIRSEANLDCAVYEMVTKGTEFVWMEALTTDEWVAIWYTDGSVAYVAAEYVEVERNEFRRKPVVLGGFLSDILRDGTETEDGNEPSPGAVTLAITPKPTATNTPTPTPSP
ncbi:MAG: hypothetical protein Q4C48_02290, partial [Lachnospiraceae bacterium]|nr:hypothetical protein [Lachnospiraceae bacterium]